MSDVKENVFKSEEFLRKVFRTAERVRSTGYHFWPTYVSPETIKMTAWVHTPLLKKPFMVECDFSILEMRESLAIGSGRKQIGDGKKDRCRFCSGDEGLQMLPEGQGAICVDCVVKFAFDEARRRINEGD